MGRHVVRSLLCMSVDGVSIGDKTLKKSAQIDLDIWIRILLDDERSRCVMDEYMGEPSIYICRIHDICDQRSDVR